MREKQNDEVGNNGLGAAKRAHGAGSKQQGVTNGECAGKPANMFDGQPFDATVRCDRCGAQGLVQAWFGAGDGALGLTFCLHHYREAEAKLADQGAVIDDRSGQF